MEEKKLTIQEEWLLTKKISVKYSTYCKYESIVTKHINPYLKENKIEELTELHIIHYIDHLINVMNLSTSIVNSIQCTLKAIYRYGERTHGLKKLDFNVIKFSQKSKTKEPLTLEKEMIIWQYCLNNKERISLAMSLGLYAGLRIGEICALKWEDVDFIQKIITVRHTIGRIYNCGLKSTERILSSPKTKNSYREIPISKQLFQALKTVRKQSQSPYVVGTSTQSKEPRSYRDYFGRLLKRLNIPHLVFHQRRYYIFSFSLRINNLTN